MKSYLELPTEVYLILKTALYQMEDADYENNARLTIGGQILLFDEDEYNNLKDFMQFGREFTEIVDVK